MKRNKDGVYEFGSERQMKAFLISKVKEDDKISEDELMDEMPMTARAMADEFSRFGNI